MLGRGGISIARVAGYGAVAVAMGVLVLWALAVYVTIPGRFSGLDRTQAAILWLSTGAIVLLVVAVHLVYARVLLHARAGAAGAGAMGEA